MFFCVISSLCFPLPACPKICPYLPHLRPPVDPGALDPFPQDFKNLFPSRHVSFVYFCSFNFSQKTGRYRVVKHTGRPVSDLFRHPFSPTSAQFSARCPVELGGRSQIYLLINRPGPRGPLCPLRPLSPFAVRRTSTRRLQFLQFSCRGRSRTPGPGTNSWIFPSLGLCMQGHAWWNLTEQSEEIHHTV